MKRLGHEKRTAYTVTLFIVNCQGIFGYVHSHLCVIRHGSFFNFFAYVSFLSQIIRRSSTQIRRGFRITVIASIQDAEHLAHIHSSEVCREGFVIPDLVRENIALWLATGGEIEEISGLDVSTVPELIEETYVHYLQNLSTLKKRTLDALAKIAKLLRVPHLALVYENGVTFSVFDKNSQSYHTIVSARMKFLKDLLRDKEKEYGLIGKIFEEEHTATI